MIQTTIANNKATFNYHEVDRYDTPNDRYIQNDTRHYVRVIRCARASHF